MVRAGLGTRFFLRVDDPARPPRETGTFGSISSSPTPGTSRCFVATGISTRRIWSAPSGSENNAPRKLDRGISYNAVSERERTTSWRHSGTTTVRSSKPRWRSKPSKEQQTLAELGAATGCIPPWWPEWKRQLREALPQLFTDRRQKPDRSAEELQAQLYQQIGQLKVELDWLKKKAGLDR